MNTQFKKGSLELCVLSFIKQEEQYGYQLAQNISQYIDIADGSLYPLLRRLVKEGYLDTYFEASTGGPARKYYVLTEAGETRLNTVHNEWTTYVKAVNQLLEDTLLK
jgi:PadR family transcriptional regulator PadR